jgi:radical SAM superfamily enzyme YgiQ (UPF0313 family)
MRVLLVFPEYLVRAFKPIGISILAPTLKKKGHEVDFFDMSNYDLGSKYSSESPELHLFKPIKTKRRYPMPNPTEDVFNAFMKKIDEFKPELIAISASYLQFKLCSDIFSKWKDRNIPVIVGGIHNTINPDDVISHDFVDMICLGEGDEAFPELVDSLTAKDNRKDIKNIWFKENGKVIRNPVRPLLSNLDNVPFVDWSLYPKYYFEKPYEGNWWLGGDLISARGCYNRCNYCFYHSYLNLYGMKKNSIRLMSPERFIEEMEYVYLEYGVNLIKVRDSDFFARDTDSLAQMAKLYQKKNNLPAILLNAYPGTVTKEKVELVKKMNCLSVGIGVESGNEKLKREYLGRYGSNNQFLKVVKIFKDAGIRVTSFNMMGLPTETRKDVYKTISLNKKANVDLADISMLFPFPGTKIFEIVKSKGYLVNNWEDITYTRSEAVLDMPQMSKEEMNGIIKVFQLYMNFPKWMWSVIKRAEKEDAAGSLLYKLLVKLFYLKKSQ